MLNDKVFVSAGNLKRLTLFNRVLRVKSVRRQTFLMTSLRKIISVSFMVRSSSLVPDFRSLTTDGRIQSGGTRRRVRMRSAGVPASGFISNRGISSLEIRLNRFRTTKGFRFSYRRKIMSVLWFRIHDLNTICCHLNLRLPVLWTAEAPTLCCVQWRYQKTAGSRTQKDPPLSWLFYTSHVWSLAGHTFSQVLITEKPSVT